MVAECYRVKSQRLAHFKQQVATGPVSSEHLQLHAKTRTPQSRLHLDVAGPQALTQPSGMLLPQKPAAHAHHLNSFSIYFQK